MYHPCRECNVSYYAPSLTTSVVNLTHYNGASLLAHSKGPGHSLFPIKKTRSPHLCQKNRTFSKMPFSDFLFRKPSRVSKRPPKLRMRAVCGLVHPLSLPQGVGVYGPLLRGPSPKKTSKMTPKIHARPK